MCVGNTLPRRKDIDDDLREAIVAPINVERVIRSFTDNLESLILHLDTCHSSLESTLQQTHPKVRLFIAQANCKEPKSFISDSTGKC